jgi:hypothetical protein
MKPSPLFNGLVCAIKKKKITYKLETSI